MASVREPTVEELATFTDLCSILNWAKLEGGRDVEDTQTGSLLFGGGAIEFGTLLDVSDFAAIDAVEFNGFITTLEYPDATTGWSLRPNLVTKSRARAAHHAARIHCGMVWSRVRNDHVMQQQITAYGAMQPPQAAPPACRPTRPPPPSPPPPSPSPRSAESEHSSDSAKRLPQ